MPGANEHRITVELARMRLWRRMGDEREAELCNDRINDLLDEISVVAHG